MVMVEQLKPACERIDDEKSFRQDLDAALSRNKSSK